MECLQVISLLFVAVTQDKLSDGALENWLEKTHEKEKLNLDDFLDATIMALWDARYLEMMKCKKCGIDRVGTGGGKSQIVCSPLREL